MNDSELCNKTLAITKNVKFIESLLNLDAATAAARFMEEVGARGTTESIYVAELAIQWLDKYCTVRKALSLAWGYKILRDAKYRVARAHENLERATADVPSVVTEAIAAAAAAGFHVEDPCPVDGNIFTEAYRMWWLIAENAMVGVPPTEEDITKFRRASRRETNQALQA